MNKRRWAGMRLAYPFLVWLAILATPVLALAWSPATGQLLPAPVQATVDTGGTARLNVRAGPGLGYAIVDKLHTGEVYSVLGRDAAGAWLQLDLTEREQPAGWVYARYVDLNASIEQLQVMDALPVPSGIGTAARAGSAMSVPMGKIAFAAFDANRGEYDIYLINADGSNVRQVVSEASQPALSPDGTRIAFRHWKRDNRGVVVKDLGTGTMLRVSVFFEDGLPAWSPDGTKLVFSSYRESDRYARLYWLWADRQRDWVYMRGPDAVYGEDPVWMPDGRILYRVIRPGNGLVMMDAAGYNPVTVLADDSAKSPALSADGQTVAFMSQRDGNWEIYRINVDGSGLQRLTVSAAQDGLPVWSPDGRFIAYVSDGGGQWAIWVMDASGSNQRQVAVMPGSIDGMVHKEPPYLNHGWLEEQISWSP